MNLCIRRVHSARHQKDHRVCGCHMLPCLTYMDFRRRLKLARAVQWYWKELVKSVPRPKLGMKRRYEKSWVTGYSMREVSICGSVNTSTMHTRTTMSSLCIVLILLLAILPPNFCKPTRPLFISVTTCFPCWEIHGQTTGGY